MGFFKLKIPGAAAKESRSFGVGVLQELETSRNVNPSTRFKYNNNIPLSNLFDHQTVLYRIS
jgi:hypothetical protein